MKTKSSNMKIRINLDSTTAFDGQELYEDDFKVQTLQKFLIKKAEQYVLPSLNKKYSKFEPCRFKLELKRFDINRNNIYACIDVMIESFQSNKYVQEGSEINIFAEID